MPAAWACRLGLGFVLLYRRLERLPYVKLNFYTHPTIFTDARFLGQTELRLRGGVRERSGTVYDMDKRETIAVASTIRKGIGLDM